MTIHIHDIHNTQTAHKSTVRCAAKTTMRFFIPVFVPVLALIVSSLLSGCSTSPSDIRGWEREGNIPKLSQTARNKKESAPIRKLSLESLARLNWEPTNQERLQVYGTFASARDYDNAQFTMQSFPAKAFSALDRDIVACANLLRRDGQWHNPDTARRLYNKIHTQNSTAVTVSLCQQVAAHSSAERTTILLLSIKLGLDVSENPLVALLLEYGDKPMAEDYLNCGSSRLNEGGRQWARAHGFNVGTGNGSHRSHWGSF